MVAEAPGPPRSRPSRQLATAIHEVHLMSIFLSDRGKHSKSLMMLCFLYCRSGDCSLRPGQGDWGLFSAVSSQQSPGTLWTSPAFLRSCEGECKSSQLSLAHRSPGARQRAERFCEQRVLHPRHPLAASLASTTTPQIDYLPLVSISFQARINTVATTAPHRVCFSAIFTAQLNSVPAFCLLQMIIQGFVWLP